MDIDSVVKNMESYRGCIEGGLVLRKFEHIKPESERRFFVLNGIVHGVRIDAMYSFAKEVAPLHKQLFYSLDVVEDANGGFMVVEIGDGQVSDFKEWSPEAWLKIFEDAQLQAVSAPIRPLC
jgi:hypothetical protein